MNMVGQIKERRAKTTKGKWTSNDDGEVHYEHPSKIWKRIVKCEFVDDANFIANAPTDIDFLIAENERLGKGQELLIEEKGIGRDEMKTEVLQKSGFRVLRLKGSDIKNNWETCKQKILSVIQSSQITKFQRVCNIVNGINWNMVIGAIKRSDIVEHQGVETELVKLNALQQVLKEI